MIKAPSIGMDSSSISLTVPGLKEDWRVDVPMRSFQGGIHYNYTSFFIAQYGLLSFRLLLSSYFVI